jgi:hypothetical protein
MEKTIEQIKILPETINKNGFCYNLVTRTSKKAIYKQTFDNVQVGFEDFLIRVRGAQYSPLLNKYLEASERFPGNSDFGKTAWSITDYQNALEIYDKL